MKLAALVTGVVLAVALPASRARALAPEKSLAELALERWQVKDGLPGDEIRAIDQASDGRLVVATFGGLTRSDGTGFVTVAAPDDLRLALTDVAIVHAARDGSVWLGAPHHRPMRLAGSSVRAFDVADGLPAGTSPLAFAEDADGHLFMASTRGLYKLGDQRFIARPVRDLDRVTVTRLAIDERGTVWLGTTAGLYLVAGERLVRARGVESGPLASGQVTALHLGRDGRLWVAAESVLYALAASAREGADIVERIDVAGPITQIEHDDDGNLWLASAAGLVRVREGRARVFREGGMPAGAVTALLVDRERGLWVGTGASGLVHLSDRTLDTHAAPAGLEGREVLAVCEDDAGALWFGARGRGALRWKDGQEHWYGVAEGLPNDVVTTLLPGAGGEVWIGTYAGLVRWRAGKIDNPGIWPGRVRTLYRDRAGALWIGGDGQLGRWADGRFTLFLPKDGLIAGHLRAISEDDTGVIWVTGVGGVVRRAGAGFVKTTALAERPAGQVRSMLLDSQGAFWLTTARGGLVRTWRGKQHSFDARVGLEPSMLYGLIEDDEGDLWIGTNKSILRIARASLEAVADGRQATVEVASFETTDRRAGVIAAQLHQPSAWKTRDGRIWFLTRNGPVRIDPVSVRSNSVPPPISIDAVLADGHPVARRRVPAPPARLEVQWSAVTLLQPSKVRYRHWLEGVDAGWSAPHAQRVAVYTRLPAGDYRFRVQASNNDGVWNQRGATFTFSVAPPFYRRLWFYLACAFALVPIGFAVHRSRLARLRAQYLGMFTERTRVARELHDTLLQGMSTVAMQLHSLRVELDQPPERARSGVRLDPRQQLELLHETVTRCLEETRRVVGGLRDGEREDATLGSALARLATRLRTDAAAARGTPAACDVLIEGRPRPLSHAVKDELYRIGQEALTNAWRHAEARRIELRLSYEVELVRLLVRDDGRGFEPARAAEGGHFGLRGLRERAARIGATLDVRSTPGAGTVVEAVVPETPRSSRMS